MLDKVADAQRMLWSTFDTKERLLFAYGVAGLLFFFYVIGRADGNEKEREREKARELADMIAERLR